MHVKLSDYLTRILVKYFNYNKVIVTVREMEKTQSLSILGSGVVGTIIGQGFLKLGYKVVFFDIDKLKVKELCNNGFDATTSLKKAVVKSAVSFVCVPTPTKRGKIDLRYIKKVTMDLGTCVGRKSCYHLIVVKSTVTPTTTENIIIPLLEKYSSKKVGNDIGVCVNPEFLTEIHSSWTSDESFYRGFFNEPVIVIGEYDKRSGDFLQALYEPLKLPIVRTNLRTAEMIKYALNCALATKISYWNEIFYICQLLDIDSDLVAQTVAKDVRIGRYGAVHGKAFGGKCLPKDLRAFIDFASSLGYDAKLLKAVEEINLRIGAEKGVRE